MQEASAEVFAESNPQPAQLVYPIDDWRIDRLGEQLKECEAKESELLVSPMKKSRLRTKLHLVEHRGSRYRGVSKNGLKWQALLMIGGKKRYLGSFGTDEEAAV